MRETEKYLQKLGNKLQNAKSTDGRASYVSDKSDLANDIEDESYQPQVICFSVIQISVWFMFEIYLTVMLTLQHYLESNEKYYQLAHRYF